MADIDHDAPDHDKAYCSTCDNRPRTSEDDAIERWIYDVENHLDIIQSSLRNCRQILALMAAKIPGREEVADGPGSVEPNDGS